MSYANSNFRQSRPQATNLGFPELHPPNRLTLLRIQYYELKVQLGSQFQRIKDKFQSVPILVNTRKKSQPENIPSEIEKNGRGARNNSGYYETRRRSRGTRRPHRVTWDADDEESDFETGEFCTPSEHKFRSSNYRKDVHTERKTISRRRSSMTCRRHRSQSPEMDHFITTMHRGFGDVSLIQNEDKVYTNCEDKCVQADAPKKLQIKSIKKLRKVLKLKRWRKKKDRETQSPEDAEIEKDDADIDSSRNETKPSMKEEKSVNAGPAILPFTSPVPWNAAPLPLQRNGEPEKTFWQHVRSFAFRKRSGELPPPRLVRFKFAGGEKRKDFEESNIPFLHKVSGGFNDSKTVVNQDGTGTALDRLNGPFSNAIPPSPLNNSASSAMNTLDNLCATLQKMCGHEVGGGGGGLPAPIAVNSPPVGNLGSLGVLSSLGGESPRYLSNVPLSTPPSALDPFNNAEEEGYVPQTTFTSRFSRLLKPQNYQPIRA